MLRCFNKKLSHGLANRGLKDGISGNILVVYSNLKSLHFAFVKRCTHVILLPVGQQESLLMIIKRILDLNHFPSSQKA